MIEGLTIGRVVHYVYTEGDVPKRPDAVGTEAPAIVVQNWDTPNGCVNLLVFADGTNDTGDASRGNVLWLTSREFSESPEPGKWHWPERA
ncbi:MAG: hypothetical protein ABFD54_08870 [Armatimonadota bacterium]|nr:hypothetical protein [bacterium]